MRSYFVCFVACRVNDTFDRVLEVGSVQYIMSLPQSRRHIRQLQLCRLVSHSFGVNGMVFDWRWPLWYLGDPYLEVLVYATTFKFPPHLPVWFIQHLVLSPFSIILTLEHLRGSGHFGGQLQQRRKLNPAEDVLPSQLISSFDPSPWDSALLSWAWNIDWLSSWLVPFSFGGGGKAMGALKLLLYFASLW